MAHFGLKTIGGMAKMTVKNHRAMISLDGLKAASSKLVLLTSLPEPLLFRPLKNSPETY